MGLTAHEIDDKRFGSTSQIRMAETEEARCRRTNGPRFAGSAGDGRSTASPRLAWLPPAPARRRAIAHGEGDMRRIVLHIGYHKTGSSALQQFLFTHRRRLSEAGILYPIPAVGPKRANITWLGQSPPTTDSIPRPSHSTSWQAWRLSGLRTQWCCRARTSLKAIRVRPLKWSGRSRRRWVPRSTRSHSSVPSMPTSTPCIRRV